MGTRNMTMVFYKGEYRVMQYGQWDGYPDGQGVTALEFARDTMKRDTFLDKVMKCRDLSREELDKIDENKNWTKEYPHLSRDMGAKILAYIQDASDGLGITLDREFAGDSLMCEWAYVLDFDKNTFEAFRGFNTAPLDPVERFASFPLDKRATKDNGLSDTYYQIKFAHSWPLDALPANDAFVAALSPPDEDEEAA